MDKKERNLIINIVWKPFFSAIMTTILIMQTELPAILIGITLGLAGSLACYLDLMKFIKNKEKSDS
ncbi:MAG: hypothetical protein E7275_04175 [Pseudobutyrivibrio sp.]|uniref:hypothetical protein n=1 Tax=Pseudobutyrivibrio sp. TaxID=2014367 RepID=UPI0025D1305F|nr:hypothetical protein [Pseudobutyrivibrio sp.]MBE5903465.1 hypothetical protein [Pseudobutyrivibrio sp.]